MDILMKHMSDGIILILLLSMPAVLLAAGIGLIIGILQAVTQVQEQTISAAPKIVLVFLLLIFGGPMMLDVLKEHLRTSFELAFEVMPRSEAMVLPPKPRTAYGMAGQSKAEFFKDKRPEGPSGKIKAMMSQPGGGGGGGEASNPRQMLNKTAPGYHPKASAAEQLYMKRRDRGTLPQPSKP